MGNHDEEEQPEEQKSGEAKAQSKQLDSLTDHVEDAEAKVDTKEVEEKLNELRKKKEESDRQLAERAKKLAQVSIKKEDLDLMCSELPLCERDALERVLREADGNLVEALRSAVRNFPMNS